MLRSLFDENKWWLRQILGVGLIVSLILKTLFGTLIGVLLLSSLLYLGLPHIAGIEPWSIRQLVLWLDDLGNDAKIGLASSLVTVLGFFIALHTTMHSWQRQTAATMRMVAADAIDIVISDVTEVLLSISLFTQSAANAIEEVRSHGLSPDAAPILSLLSEDVTEFRSNRQRLLQLHQQLIALPARYTVIFLPVSGVLTYLEAIEEHVCVVTTKVWVAAPAGGTTHPDHRRHLLERVDSVKYRELSEVSDAARDKIVVLQARIRSALLSPVFEANATSFGRVIRQMFEGTSKDTSID